MKIVVSEEAHNDIDSIFKYISLDSLKYANETVEKLYSRIAELETSPYLGRYIPELKSK